jgi:hypothetical protein
VAFLEHDAVVRDIIGVMTEFDSLLTSIAWAPRFHEKDRLLVGADRYHNAVRDIGYLTALLRRLKNEVLLELYYDCRALANKYNLSCTLTPGTIELSSADIERDAYSLDYVFPFGFRASWEHKAPQAGCGYADQFDPLSQSIGFDIHSTKFELDDNVVLRLWKGYYGVAGGEIGFYGGQRTIYNREMKEKAAESIRQFGRLAGKEIDGEYILNVLLELPAEELRQHLISLTPFYLRNNTVYQFIDFITELKGRLRNDGEVFSRTWSHSLSPEELREYLGLSGTTIQIFYKDTNKFITEHREYKPEYWTTTFTPNMNSDIKNKIYTINHFYFENALRAEEFYRKLRLVHDNAVNYPYNGKRNINDSEKEPIIIPAMPNATTVIIEYGDHR